MIFSINYKVLIIEGIVTREVGWLISQLEIIVIFLDVTKVFQRLVHFSNYMYIFVGITGITRDIQQFTSFCCCLYQQFISSH